MKDDLMPVQQFEMIYATACQLVRASAKLFDLTDSMKTVDAELYAEVIMMHNASCDFIEAYQKLSKED